MLPLSMNIQKIRERVGVSSKVWADMLSTWYQNVRNWETGKHKPTNKIRADVFQILLDTILDEENDPLISSAELELLMSCTRDQQDSAMIRVLLTKLNETGKGK